MADASVLSTIIQALMNKAQPRPDIVTPGSNGTTLENVRPYTFAGRVGNANAPETPQQMMARSPMGDNEEGAGLGAAGIEALKQFMPQLSASAAGKLGPVLFGAMAKSFKPGAASSPARLAAPNAIPSTPYEQMYPALVDAKTGDVIHAMRATGAGGHAPLYEQAAAIKGFQPVRAFLDPNTFDVYTEAQLEKIAAMRAAAASRGGVAAWR